MISHGLRAETTAGHYIRLGDLGSDLFDSKLRFWVEPAYWFLLCALRQRRRTADLSSGKDAALRVAVSLGR